MGRVSWIGRGPGCGGTPGKCGSWSIALLAGFRRVLARPAGCAVASRPQLRLPAGRGLSRPRTQSVQPEIVFTGSQLSGMLLITDVVVRVT